MSSTPIDATPSAYRGMARDDAGHDDSTTRHRVLRLVAESGPISVVEMARELALTAAGIRRHVAALEESEQVVVHAARTVRTATGAALRGRPARRYVVTVRGQAALASAYAGLATSVIEYLAASGGTPAVEGFAAHRADELVERHRAAIDAAGDDVVGRARALAEGLAAEGYAASTRPAPIGGAIQLCQGHCPVQDVAARFPQLCEAETQAFSQVLGVHVQRLSTIAAGGHACTTHVPTGARAAPRPTAVRRTSPTVRTAERPARAGAVEGTR